MKQFVITYLGGNQPASEDEGRQHMARYMAWLNDLGDAAVSPANPLGGTHTIGPDGSVTKGSSSSMSGYTIVAAASLDDAIDIAKQCPFLEVGGSLEVSELLQMPGRADD